MFFFSAADKVIRRVAVMATVVGRATAKGTLMNGLPRVFFLGRGRCLVQAAKLIWHALTCCDAYVVVRPSVDEMNRLIMNSPLKQG